MNTLLADLWVLLRVILISGSCVVLLLFFALLIRWLWQQLRPRKSHD